MKSFQSILKFENIFSLPWTGVRSDFKGSLEDHSTSIQEAEQSLQTSLFLECLYLLAVSSLLFPFSLSVRVIWFSLALISEICRPKVFKSLKAKLFCPSQQLDLSESICQWQQINNHRAIPCQGKNLSLQPARSLCFYVKLITHLWTRSDSSAASL